MFVSMKMGIRNTPWEQCLACPTDRSRPAHRTFGIFRLQTLHMKQLSSNRPDNTQDAKVGWSHSNLYNLSSALQCMCLILDSCCNAVQMTACGSCCVTWLTEKSMPTVMAVMAWSSVMLKAVIMKSLQGALAYLLTRPALI